MAHLKYNLLNRRFGKIVVRTRRINDLSGGCMTKYCEYCQQEAPLLRHGDAGYPYQSDYGPVYACQPCGAHVGVHPGTTKPLGRLANAELRTAKILAHAAFDPLWKRKIAKDKCSKSHARRAGYKWLSQQLGIPAKETHIGHFDVDQCMKVVEVCNAVTTREVGD